MGDLEYCQRIRPGDHKNDSHRMQVWISEVEVESEKSHVRSLRGHRPVRRGFSGPDSSEPDWSEILERGGRVIQLPQRLPRHQRKHGKGRQGQWGRADLGDL